MAQQAQRNAVDAAEKATASKIGQAGAKAKAKPKKKAADKLVIVESPAKAKTISKFLGKGYRVVASNGHVRDLPKSQLGVDIDNDFAPRYITLRGRGEVLGKIRKEAKGAGRVFLATDPDREGEAISWHLAQVLGIEPNVPCRIVFNEITPSAIKSAIKTPRSIDMNLVDAQQARRILDRLVGYKISPILWVKVRKGLSAGRVQSVATRLIVDREEEIRSFVPVEYWTLDATLLEPRKKKAFVARFYGKNGKKLELPDKELCHAVLNAVRDAQFIAKSIKRGEKSKHPSPPFTTSNLQQEASRKLGFTTKRAMMVAQQLYEGVDLPGRGSVGLVTYIRTDSVRISDDAMSAVRGMIGERFGAAFLPAKPNFYKGRKDAQDAHEAIRPTYLDLTPESLKGTLSNDQYKLYRLIYERFVASQMASARYETMSVMIAVGEYEFRASGSRMIFEGFTKVYTEGRDDVQDEKESMLPDIHEGDVFDVKELKDEQHFTQPPPRFTEATLVKTLEEKGIGRPSTYSPTISTITDRGYVRREKKVLHPTELGEIITKLMKENFQNIIDVAFTAQMEEDLDEIEGGEKTWEGVLHEFYGPFAQELAIAEEKIEKIEIVDEVSDIPCDKCGAMMVYKLGRFGKFLACPNYPECKNTKPIIEKIDVPCPACGASLIKRKSRKGGRIFYGCERYPDCDYISWDMPAKQPCPKCGGVMIHKSARGKNELRCTNKECGHVEAAPQAEQGAGHE